MNETINKTEYDAELPYRIGGLLYMPAVNAEAASKLIGNRIPHLTAAAFCLEDSIRDDAVAEAEHCLCDTMNMLLAEKEAGAGMPLLFVRIRTPEHLRHVDSLLRPYYDLIKGYIFPKFDSDNASEYLDSLLRIGENCGHPVYGMPILESGMLADKRTRTDCLFRLKEQLDAVRELIPNIRVGGDDFCNLYGIRRNITQNIYQIGVVRDILTDILSVFSQDYVVSGPVWEYFGKNADDAWAEGLREELVLDRLNGFIGKTAIHPSQLPLIAESLRVSEADYRDAERILRWRSDTLGVEKSADGSRMNERKCHIRWAERIILLGKLYGVRKTGSQAETDIICAEEGRK